MNELLKKIEKSKSIDLNLELKTLILDDIKALLLSTYIVDNNIAQVRESYDKKDATSEISDTTKFYLESIRKGENKEGIKDKVFSNLIDRGVIQAIKNIKAHFSLIELINETNLITLQFLKNFYPKLSKKYDEKKISEIFDVYCAIKQLMLQIKKENEEFSTKISILVYLKVRDRLEKNEELNSVLKGMGLKKEYFENLDQMYRGIEIEDLGDVYSYTEKVTDEFNSNRQIFMFNYFEENLLIKYLNLEDKKNTKDDICKALKIEDKKYDEMLNDILKKVSETEEA
ncbi:hypothetical protein ACFFBA_000024 [Sneathia vaginalis]|jgi:hypothetical protein|uniref:Uncharacterized protein n=1 Tax=Sneathia vaginalis TaxID=187101 RepID=A0A0E3ZBY7_9FUSO|nr:MULTISPECIES: hypothetical protein [Sneathia]AKC95822.1 hypothetical protein VC03_04890 [Sneathia vaginalis]MBE3030847.1 hypothetical protein [Sneathia sp. DSM 16631]MDK9581364.1 hypothetical protein [Sneathia vaginalis]